MVALTGEMRAQWEAERERREIAELERLALLLLAKPRFSIYQDGRGCI